MFAIEVEYLFTRVYCGSFEDSGRPEWPPHPARLYSALVCAHFETGASSESRAALEWLESQPAPSIYASHAGQPGEVTAFVPTNYPGDGPPVLRGKQPRQFPAVVPEHAAVYLIWPDAEPTGAVRAALDDLAFRTGYLGRASSLVRIRVADEAPVPNYRPSPAGPELMRIASRGRLRELENQFQAGLRPSFGLQQRYEPVRADLTAALRGNFGEMLMFRRVDGHSLPIEASLTLTQAVRKALLAVAGQSGPIPEALHGHGLAGHCAVAALPFAGHEHADGHLVGFSIVLPRAISAADRIAVVRACAALQVVHLPAPLLSWKVELLRERPRERTLRQSTWTGSAKAWSSITPILLDRFPKKKGPNVEDILATACENAGLPKPAALEHGVYSCFHGVAPVPQFRLQREIDSRPRWGVHATIHFDQPVAGPVLLGGGRFSGLGLMAHTPDRKGDSR